MAHLSSDMTGGVEVRRRAAALMTAYDGWLAGGPDVRAAFETVCPRLDGLAVAVLDCAEEQALIRQDGETRSWLQRIGIGRGREPLSALIADFVVLRSADWVPLRERALRLIGMPFPSQAEIETDEQVTAVYILGFKVAGVINHMGVRRARRNDLAAAVRYMSAALVVCPIHVEALINRGKARLMTGQVEEGLQDYEVASCFAQDDEEVAGILARYGRGRKRR